MPRLPTFLHQYPGIALELCSSDRQVDLLREDFDCVVRTEPLHSRSAWREIETKTGQSSDR
ncbi:LysR substrate-binding domain-containing protein [Salmonella enterica subsp. enterica serovar Lubbock]|nr:LysR substrate-binding domain-containing protein [Salmonella enterica subsp. enterica serovar Lubbock]